MIIAGQRGDGAGTGPFSVPRRITWLDVVLVKVASLVVVHPLEQFADIAEAGQISYESFVHKLLNRPT